MAFVNFHKHKIQKLFQRDQEYERQDIQLSIEKNTSAKRLQMMLDLKMCPSPLFD